MKTADKFLEEASATFRAKNAEYGTNYLRVGAAMAAMFPDGVTLKTADDWNRMHIFLLAVVKKTRYATNWEKGGHADSIRDETVYNAMLESIDADIAMRPCTTPCSRALMRISRGLTYLIKRLEAEASKFDKRVVASLRNRYDFCAGDTRDILLAAAKRIKELEAPSEADRLEIEERKLW